MGYLTKTRTYQTVQLSGGYTATVQKLSKLQQDQHMEATPGEAARIVTDGALDNAGYTTSLLLAGIVEWNLDDEAGTILPMTRDVIENVLTAQDAATLVVAINALAGGLDPNAVIGTPSGSSTP
jgi:hypothetical protein